MMVPEPYLTTEYLMRTAGCSTRAEYEQFLASEKKWLAQFEIECVAKAAQVRREYQFMNRR